MTYLTNQHNYQLRERCKVVARNSLALRDLPLEKRVEAAQALFYSHFHRSLEKYWMFTRKHPAFEEYVAMLLSNKDFWSKQCGNDVYSVLVEKFGIIPNEIPAGKTFFYDPGNILRQDQFKTATTSQGNA